MKDGIIYVNPCHGNEPYILGTLIAYNAREKSGKKPLIVIPHMYGERQRKIISEELKISPEEFAAHNICLDEKLGQMHKQLLFSSNDFKGHLETAIKNQEAAQKAVTEHLKNNYGHVYFEVNIASRVTSGATRTYFAFPVIISELLERTVQEKELSKTFSAELLEPMIGIMKKVERSISMFFIPQYHTFSFDENRKPHEHEIATPPLKPVPKKSTEELHKNSMFCMLSGTDSEIQNVLKNAAKFKEIGYHIIVPPSAKDADAPKEYERRILQDIISNKNLVKVMGRPGWGTLWLCQVGGKDFLPTSYTEGDDPEIYFNHKTLAKLPIALATARQEKDFGTLDGIAFVVDKIAKDL